MAPSAAEAVEVASWIALARAGDLGAFERLVRLHQSRVRLQLRRLTQGDHALADDLAQDTFVQAWQHLGDFRGEARLSTWLHRIALNRWLQHVRRPHPPAEWATRPADADADTGADGDHGAPVRNTPREPGHDPRGVEGLRLDVEAALRDLSEAQRLAVVHCFHLDLSHEEAAEVLGLPLGTLKSHLARAKARLRVALGAWSEAAVP
jgi:RNA polymerase sigma-70 factor (ECF subfamily)